MLNQLQVFVLLAFLIFPKIIIIALIKSSIVRDNNKKEKIMST